MQAISKIAITNDQDVQVVQAFLDEKKKTGDADVNVYSDTLRVFFNAVNVPLAQLTRKDLRAFLVAINDMDYKINTKNRHKGLVSGFLEFASDQLNIDLPAMPKSFTFTSSSEAARRVTSKGRMLTGDQMAKLLDLAKDASFRDYIFFLLAKHCGARCMEIATLKKADVDIAARRFTTGFEQGARKNNKSGETPLIFHFPKFLVPIIKYYLAMLPTNEVWMFPSFRGRFVKPNGLEQKYSEKAGFRFGFHDFRRTLTTRRMKNGCQEWASEKLMNHAATTTERKSYNCVDEADLLGLYDSCHPYNSP